MSIHAPRTPLPFTALLLTMLGAASGACAAIPEGFYAGGQISQFDYEENGFDGATPTAIGVLGGYRFTPNLAAEVRAGAGISGDTIDGVGVKLRSYFTGAVKGSLPVSENFGIYGLLGVTGATLAATYQDASETTHGSGLSYGFGVEFALGAARNLALSAEWNRLLSTHDYDLDQLGVGLAVRF